MNETTQKTPAEIAIAKLAEMLEQYRNDQRGLPTYAELAALVQS